MVFSCISSFAGISVITIANKITVTCLRIRKTKVYSYYILHIITMQKCYFARFLDWQTQCRVVLASKKSPSFACTVGYDFLPLPPVIGAVDG